MLSLSDGTGSYKEHKNYKRKQIIFIKRKAPNAICASRLSTGRGDRIRTCGLYVPNVALHQTELHLEFTELSKLKSSLDSSSRPDIGCGTRIRTQTNRVRVCRATITQFRIEQQYLLYTKSKISQAFFIIFHLFFYLL